MSISRWMDKEDVAHIYAQTHTHRHNGILLLLLSCFSRVRLCAIPKLRRPWDSPGKNTGVGYHFLLQCMKVKSESEVAQSCPTLSDPMDCSSPGSPCPWDFPGRSTEVGCDCLLRNGILLSHKTQWNNCWLNMDGPRDYHTKADNNKFQVISLICGF